MVNKAGFKEELAKNHGYSFIPEDGGNKLPQLLILT